MQCILYTVQCVMCIAYKTLLMSQTTPIFSTTSDPLVYVMFNLEIYQLMWFLELRSDFIVSTTDKKSISL